MQNEQTKKMSWEALLVGSVFSLIFLLTFRLALAWEASPSLNKSSLEKSPSFDTQSWVPECDLNLDNDCDNDGMPNDCDADSTDPENFEPKNGEDGCDRETDPDNNILYMGDGYVDKTCRLFNKNEDGTLDDNRTDEVESYAFNVCDNCPTKWNPEQLDFDGDNFGDECDPSSNTPNSIGGQEEEEQKDPADEEDDAVEQRDPVVAEEELKFSS